MYEIIVFSPGLVIGAFVVGFFVIDSIRDGNKATDERDKALTDYATERRKRLEAEQAHADLADKHNVLLEKAYIRDGARFVRVKP